MNIKIIILLFVTSCLVLLSLFAQQQSTIPILEPVEVIQFTDKQINFWLDAEDYIAKQLNLV